MTQSVPGVTSTASVSSAGTVDWAGDTSDTSLPAPSLATNPNDAVEFLLGLLGTINASQSKTAGAQIQAQQQEIRENLKRQLEAIERAAAAEREGGGGLFGAIGRLAKGYIENLTELKPENLTAVTVDAGFLRKVMSDPVLSRDLEKLSGGTMKAVAVGAAVAACFFTGGAAAPLALAIVGAVLTSAAAVDGQYHVLEGLGVPARTAAILDIAMGVAGGLCTGESTLLASKAGEASTAATAIRGTANVTQGISSVGGGAATIGVGLAEYDADNARIDQASAKHAQEMIQDVLEAILTEYSDQQSTDDKTRQIVGQISQTQGQTLIASAGAVRA